MALFTERQLDMVVSWRSQGYTVFEKQEEEVLKVYAIKDGGSILLFVLPVVPKAQQVG